MSEGREGLNVLYFHVADDQRDFSEYCMVANSEFFTTSSLYHCYKSVVKLLLAQLAKWGKVCYSTIITVFCIDKMASCRLHAQCEGKAEVADTQSSGIISS